MRMRLICTAALALGAVLGFAATAGAKQFGPGDLKLCDNDHCVVIMDQSLLNGLSRFYYGGPAPAKVRKPRLGAPYLQLKFADGGYVTGVAATAQFDRFRSGGVNLGQFSPDDWYRVPAKVARGLRKLAVGLKPLRVSESVIVRTRYG
jgi:hypothetical protein